MIKKDFLKEPVKHIDIKSFDSTEIIKGFRGMSFTARETAGAADIFSEMINDKDCTIILCIAGSSSAAGCMQIYADMVRHNMADLADLCAAEPPGPTVALVDGTLILWVLEDHDDEWPRAKVTAHLEQVHRIRQAGAAVAAFTSRPRRTEVTRLAYLAGLDGDANRASREPNPLEHLPDRAVFEMLPPGARSALFVSPPPMDHSTPPQADDTDRVYFCYINVAAGGHDPVIARIEFPAWVAASPDMSALVHGAIVAQARITGDYPYALARADELAYISAQEREAFEAMITTALLRAGLRSALSPKAYYKTLTRQGRRKHRV